MSKYTVKVGKEFEVNYVGIVADDGPDGGGERVTTDSGDNDSDSRSSPEGVLGKYASLQRGKVEDRDSKIRSLLTISVIVVVSVALVVATILGWKTDNFSGLQQVWNVGSVFVTYVITYYFMERHVGSRKAIGYEERYSAGSD